MDPMFMLFFGHKKYQCNEKVEPKTQHVETDKPIRMRGFDPHGVGE
jgi:hypothetical protein